MVEPETGRLWVLVAGDIAVGVAEGDSQSSVQGMTEGREVERGRERGWGGGGGEREEEERKGE